MPISKSIIKFLNKCSEAYYSGNPIIDDDVFDHLSEKYGYNSFGTSDISDRICHLYPMLSLEKFYTDDNKIPKFSNAIISPKLDGAAIELVYINKEFAWASTRGDGFEGEDISEKIERSSLVPKKLEFNQLLSTQITGELVAPKTIKNSRNYAAGAANLKSIEEFLERDLTFIAYGIKPSITNSYALDMQLLKDSGFNTVIDSDWKDFPRDGIVFRCDNNKEYSEFGYTSKHPKGAFALKDRKDIATVETELLKVAWQVGKGGKVTPVAIFKDINIGGANINRATLHNAGFIENLDLKIGDTLLITRSGGIIPKVVGVL